MPPTTNVPFSNVRLSRNIQNEFEAGLPKGISAHGLRKATARRLADLGCTAHQIAAVTGHATLAEVQRYTKAADRKRLAREAMKKLIESGS